MNDENEYADIYGAMNLLDEALRRRRADHVVAGIEAWLGEDDQDCPDWREALAQGVQDAIVHSMIIDKGYATITLVQGHEKMLRFEMLVGTGRSKTFDKMVIGTVKRFLKEIS